MQLLKTKLSKKPTSKSRKKLKKKRRKVPRKGRSSKRGKKVRKKSRSNRKRSSKRRKKKKVGPNQRRGWRGWKYTFFVNILYFINWQAWVLIPKHVLTRFLIPPNTNSNWEPKVGCPSTFHCIAVDKIPFILISDHVYYVNKQMIMVHRLWIDFFKALISLSFFRLALSWRIWILVY